VKNSKPLPLNQNWDTLIQRGIEWMSPAREGLISGFVSRSQTSLGALRAQLHDSPTLP